MVKVKAEEQEQCWKCRGTGQYRNFGVCFLCKGKGTISSKQGFVLDNRADQKPVAKFNCADGKHQWFAIPGRTYCGLCGETE